MCCGACPQHIADQVVGVPGFLGIRIITGRQHGVGELLRTELAVHQGGYPLAVQFNGV